MNERRGFYRPTVREPHYCETCKATSAFEVGRDEQGRKVLVCIGDSRGPNPRPGCGKKLLDTGIRHFGECRDCRKVRRAVRMPDGTYRCAICARNIHAVEDYKCDD